MKYLKAYEDINDKPKEGDYVLMGINLSSKIPSLKYHKQLEEYLSNNFGKIDSINFRYEDVNVKYYNIPEEIQSWFSIKKDTYYRKFNINRIIEFASTEEDLKLKIAAKKYNL